MNDQHGKFSVEAYGDTVRYELIGAFNEKAAAECTEAIKHHINSLDTQRFKLLNVQNQFEGSTPGAYRIADELNEWLNRQDMIAKAIVSHSSVIAQIDQLYVPSKKRQNIQYFTDEKDAVQWLESQ